MKALSIKQPWASLVCTPRLDNPLLGIKDIENRTWATKYRGTIYIHTSGKSAGELNLLLTEDQYESLPSVAFLSENYPKSAIIGTVDIVDCVINHPSIWADKTDYDSYLRCRECADHDDICPFDNLPCDEPRMKPIYNWVLANPVLFDEPILNVKGKLSLWEFEGNG